MNRGRIRRDTIAWCGGSQGGAWLDRKIGSRTAKVVAGMLLGLAAIMLIPVFTGLMGV